MDEPHKPTLLERLSAFLLREPEDREQLLTLLRVLRLYPEVTW